MDSDGASPSSTNLNLKTALFPILNRKPRILIPMIINNPAEIFSYSEITISY